MTVLSQLLAATRRMDGTFAGEKAAQAALADVDAPPEVLAAEAGALARRAAGHLNTPGSPGWDERDDGEADRTLCAAMDGIHHGGRTPQPNLSLVADRAMTALVQLARERDHDDRLATARLQGAAQDAAMIAYVGLQLVWYLASLTGDVEGFCDALELELMEAHYDNPNGEDR